MTIHREGHRLLSVAFLIVLLLLSLTWAYLPWPWLSSLLTIGLAAFFLFLLQFFRNPSRQLVVDASLLICPADGKVVVIEEVYEPEYLQTQCRQISIFMSPLNVHINRAVAAGTVSYFKYHPGKYLVAWHPKSSTENERTSLALKLHNNQEVLLRQIAGAVARRIRWYVKQGDSLAQGQEFGFIKFGSRVDIFVPLDAEIKVTLGQKVKGGLTVLAQLNK
ncbi:phosphatidylserine decarboxylase family protein [Eisenibacter elegans]|jgi:phosphatidylserine decarboxylase|uniref:phosphatidylserine decarboxylase family protein n=1 Tax=Eisenibacter elegans TaxID=997 RepID=UPI00042593A7|nr:phosphatidylserine decarboxylase family protein [Eisenibacter elegans]